MTKKAAIQLFEEKKVRTIWDDEQEKWYFSVVDVVSILTGSKDATSYWRKLKQRLKAEGNETVTICNGLRMLAADGKMRLTDVADSEQLFRLIQSIPSPKAEPFKLRMAQVASERIDELQDPELTIYRAMWEYKRLGYSDNWINQRLKSIEVRKQLTDELTTIRIQLNLFKLLRSEGRRQSQWKRCGMQEGQQFASLTDIITHSWSGRTTKEYKNLKGLKKENLRDNMTNTELILNMLAEAATTDISKEKNPQNFDENANIANHGGKVARVARQQLESQLCHSVIFPLNARKGIKQIDTKEQTEDE